MKNMDIPNKNRYNTFENKIHLAQAETRYQWAAELNSEKIDTTFGEIDLKIDDWQDAKSKREELEESWNGKFIRHRRKTIRKV